MEANIALSFSQKEAKQLPAFHYSQEVIDAFKKSASPPIVALESNIISFGFPHPDNWNLAKNLESIVRENGAIPATIAIINGEIHIGLSASELASFSALPKASVKKCSKRDLPYIISHNLNGATTVAATMYLAHLSNIHLMATEGIGGVHRGVETTFDISADLVELAKTPLAVVCSGAKSILDIPKTLELLETLGVPVIAYKSEYFPDFYTESCGIKAPFTVNSAQECAEVIKCSENLKMENGIVIGVPIPKEKAADGEKIKQAINIALKEAEEKKIAGNAVTHYLMKRITEITDGNSEKSNIELLKNNAMVAAKIAVEISNKE